MTRKHVNKVLIVGAGIGGLTTAIALQKIGIKTEIVEKSAEWNVYGVGIIQPCNMLRALDEIGLAQDCMKEGYPYPGYNYHKGDGYLMFGGDSPTIEGYPANNGISRKTLHKLLLEKALAEGTTIQMGTTIASLEELSDGISVELTNGQTATYDLVVASDGANSMMREKLFGQKKLTYSELGVWRYTLKKPENITRGAFYYGEQSKAGIVPMSDDEMYLLLTSHEPSTERFPEDQLHELLKERLAEYSGLIAELKEQIVEPANVVYRPIYTGFLAGDWYKGRILLIGDAAHTTSPHLGQGASITIEDAVVLAEILKQDLSVEETFKIFMKLRYERCKFVVDASDQLIEWELLEWRKALPPEVNFAKYAIEAIIEMNKPIMDDSIIDGAKVEG